MTPREHAQDMAALAEDFPSFRIWQEVTGDRVRFIARSVVAGNHPHTLITADLTELRTELAHGRRAVDPGSDRRRPNVARMYSYWLGGKDHLAADRQAADEVLACFPEVVLLARANRSFVARAVRYASAEGITQFLDVGAGLPESPNVHEIAQQVSPAARVAYVDCDPVVVAHTHAVLVGDPGVTAVAGDMRDPDSILTSPELRTVIDLSRPVCVLLASVLHFVPPTEADAIVAAFRSAMAPGSFLILSTGTSTGTDPDLLTRLEHAYAGTTVVSSRTADEIAAYFTGLRLEPPGLVDVWAWRPDHEWFWPAPPAGRILGGVGRKPDDPIGSQAKPPAPRPPRAAA